MSDHYIFREITKTEIPQMFSMILERMKWMDEKGIRQWNVTDYDKVFPQAYYEAKRQMGEVFVLAEINGNKIVCAAVLQEQDNYWPDCEKALYVHNFVSQIGERKVGEIFLRYVDEIARQRGKRCLRLDSAVDNQKLAEYYEAQGFIAVGKCEDGPYQGILRQKPLV